MRFVDKGAYMNWLTPGAYKVGYDFFARVFAGEPALWTQLVVVPHDTDYSDLAVREFMERARSVRTYPHLLAPAFTRSRRPSPPPIPTHSTNR